MKLLRGHKYLKPILQGTVATIGNFDGIHCGHQKILNYVNQQAQQNKLKSVLVSFQPTAKEYFSEESAPARIYPLRKKTSNYTNHGLGLFCMFAL